MGRAGRGRLRAGFAGALAGAVALGMSELTAGLTGARSLVVAVGDAVIAKSPQSMVEFGKRTFGTDDKAALVTGILIIAGLAAVALGVAANRRRWVAVAGLGAFGVVGIAAAAREPQGAVGLAALAAIVGVASGLSALLLLLGGRSAAPHPTGMSRRAFLGMAAAAAATAAISGAVGRALLQGATKAAARAGIVLPRLTVPLAPPPAGTSLAVDGVTSLVTPNNQFYLIDTTLSYPQVDVEGWRLRIDGMVEHPCELSFADLLAMPMIEQYVTIGCVSNEVGGDLVSTAAWRGVPLRDLLGRAGVRADATQVIGRSVDAFTVGFPTEAALDERGAMVAVGMNGVPLPIAHGFPARLIVPGLYGYVSATKWLREIELSTFEAFDAYWIRRGWAQKPLFKTQSRIDVPKTGRAGRVPVAGVAWAPTRGIAKVEVQIDDLGWSEATLASQLSADTWRQWVYQWNASPGRHRLRVRATDGTGRLQDGRDHPPLPDGATGYHTIHVEISAS